MLGLEKVFRILGKDAALLLVCQTAAGTPPFPLSSGPDARSSNVAKETVWMLVAWCRQGIGWAGKYVGKAVQFEWPFLHFVPFPYEFTISIRRIPVHCTLRAPKFPLQLSSSTW